MFQDELNSVVQPGSSIWTDASFTSIAQSSLLAQLFAIPRRLFGHELSVMADGANAPIPELLKITCLHRLLKRQDQR